MPIPLPTKPKDGSDYFKAGVCADNYKVKQFEAAFTKKGYEFTKGPGIVKKTTLFQVKVPVDGLPAFERFLRHLNSMASRQN